MLLPFIILIRCYKWNMIETFFQRPRCFDTNKYAKGKNVSRDKQYGKDTSPLQSQKQKTKWTK